MLYFLLGFFALLVYFIVCRADMIARQLAFHPTKYPHGDWNAGRAEVEEIRFKNSRHETLVGWYFPVRDDSRPVILYCHGNAENVSDLSDLARGLRQQLNANVLVFDYAGYGKSEGSPTAPGILDDGRAARRWLAERNGIPETDIIVYGQSLGGSVAVDLAAKDGAKGLIVESSFTSFGDMGRRLFPFLPVNWLLKENLASVEKIGNFRGPVFISHGKADFTIPFEQGKRLFDAANEPKTFYVPPSGFDYHSAPLCAEHIRKLHEFVDAIPSSD